MFYGIGLFEYSTQQLDAYEMIILAVDRFFLVLYL